jgi:hypothetical protein
VLHPVEEPTACLEKATSHVYISTSEIIQAAPNASKKDNRGCDSKLDQFTNVPCGLEPRIKILILLVLRLAVELLLELGNYRSCDFRPNAIRNRRNPRVVGDKIEAVPWHQKQSLR